MTTLPRYFSAIRYIEIVPYDTESRETKGNWSLRRTAGFVVVVTSTLLWTVIILPGWFVLSL